jgi:hypothetical protein
MIGLRAKLPLRKVYCYESSEHAKEAKRQRIVAPVKKK